jgi:5'-3' exonuclease
MKDRRIPQKKERVVLIDGRNLLYRSHFSHNGLQSKGESTSAIFGYPSILKSIIWKLKPKKIYVVWDGKKSQRRMELLPDYKRRDKPRLGFDYEDFDRQEKVVKQILKYLGISQVYHPRMEADDLIYALSERYKKTRNVYIVSSDKDFDQLLCSRVRIWNDKDNKLITHKNCKKLKGYTPEQCVSFLALTGDKSDNIPGYKGIGEKKAIQFLEKHGSIESWLYDNEHIEPFKGIEPEKLKALWKINKEMIDLRHHWEWNCRHIVPADHFIKPDFNIDAFKKLAKKYSMDSLKKNIFVSEFKKQFYRSNKNTKLKDYGKVKIKSDPSN